MPILVNKIVLNTKNIVDPMEWNLKKSINPVPGLEEVSWWPTEYLAKDNEARCRIDLEPVLSLTLELWVASTHLVNSLKPLCGEFFEWF